MDQKLPYSDEYLVAMWHSKQSSATIVKDLNTTGHRLESAWRRLKREGKLPQASRQHPTSGATPSREIEGRPDVYDTHDDDKLLSRLIKEFGPNGRPDIFKRRIKDG